MPDHTPRRRPTYAGVAATAALALAIGFGGAYAAPKIGAGDIKPNAVRSQHIKNGQVQTADLRNGSVTPAKLRNPGALRTRVISYSLGTHNFATSSILGRALPQVAGAAVPASEWSVQLVRASGNVYPVPGPGLNGASTYRVYVTTINGAPEVTITLNSGTGEEYVDVRVIRTIPTSSPVVPASARVAPRAER